MVVKADGLAAGKGVIVAQTLEEAEAALAECFVERRFGDAASTVLMEEFLEGEEVSLLSIVSGDQILPLAPAQDYKRALDGDAGPQHRGHGIVLAGAGRGRRAVRADRWRAWCGPRWPSSAGGASTSGGCSTRG